MPVFIKKLFMTLVKDSKADFISGSTTMGFTMGKEMGFNLEYNKEG